MRRVLLVILGGVGVLFVIEILIQNGLSGARLRFCLPFVVLCLVENASESLLLLGELDACKLPEAEFVLQLLFVQDQRQRDVVLLRFCLENIAEDDGLDARPLGWVLVQHLLEEIHEVLAHEVRMLGDLVVQDFVLKFVHLCGRERIAQAAHLVQYDTECPNI